MKQGVPQDGVLSHTIFNFYMSTFSILKNSIKLSSYSGDINIEVSGLARYWGLNSIQPTNKQFLIFIIRPIYFLLNFKSCLRASRLRKLNV